MTVTNQKIAAIQLASGPNVGANLDEAEKLIRSAAAADAQLLVLPENFAFMGKQDAELLDVAEREHEGPIQQFLASICKELGIWLVGGTIPLLSSDADKVRAACLVYDDTGTRIARYDKIHLFDVNLVEQDEKYRESERIEPGQDVVVIDTPLGRLGLAVCYDLRFPELFRAMLDKGVELIALPAAFTATTGKAHWEPLVRARAIENLSYVIAAAQGGFHVSGRETYGHSMIVDPWGLIVAEQARGNGFVIHQMDNVRLGQTRQNFPCLDHRQLMCG